MKTIKDVAYTLLCHPQQKLDIYLPDNGSDFPTFLYFHGGGLEAGDKSLGKEFTEYYTSRGVALVSANYRMYPEAVFPQFINDAASAVAFIKKNGNKYGIGDKLFVGGSSAGGYLSMMLCFDEKYLSPYGIKPSDITGFVHDAGQPTSHFNVLREKGIDSRRVIIDETAPLYHICAGKELPPMQFIVSTHDMENRYEQTMLTLSTLRHFRYDESKIYLKVMDGTHCEYCGKTDENGDNVFAKISFEFIEKYI